ncbi:MAG TPA: hypothetical protein VN600_06870 [Gemmatimonadaceae bacterium]|nr:hypothetical protein [Gemmatimonadaceae bacterium]
MTTMITRVKPTRSQAARDRKPRKPPTPHGQSFAAPVDPGIAERAAAVRAASAKAGGRAAKLFRKEMAKSIARRRRRGELASDAQIAAARAELDRITAESRGGRACGRGKKLAVKRGVRS